MFPKNLERPVLWSWFFQIPGTSGSLKNQRTTQHWFQQSQWRAHSQLITLCLVCEVSELRHSLSITIYRQISSRRQKIFLNETQGFDFHAMPITAPHLQVQKSNLTQTTPLYLYVEKGERSYKLIDRVAILIIKFAWMIRFRVVSSPNSHIWCTGFHNPYQ